MPTPVTGSFTATGQSASFEPHVSANPNDSSPFNIALTGTGVAAIQLEKSFDRGTTWCLLYAGGVQLKQWNHTGTNIAESYEESESSVLYRLNCTSYTSGTITYRISQ